MRCRWRSPRSQRSWRVPGRIVPDVSWRHGSAGRNDYPSHDDQNEITPGGSACPTSASEPCAGTSTRRGPRSSKPARRADRLGFDTLWTWDHLYPIVGQLGRADPRGLADPGGVGPGHRADPDRPDGRREHVPRAGAHGQDGDDARPHLRRPGHPRHRRGMVRGGAPRLRHPVRRRLPGAPALAGRGAADHARHAPRRAPDGGRSALLGEWRPQRPAARPAAPAAARRWWRRAGHAQARGALCRREQRRWRDRGRPPQGGDPASSTARPSDGTRPRSSGRPGSAPSSSATRATRPERVHAAIFERNGRAEPWKDQPVGTPEDVAERLMRRTSTSATAISSPASRRRMTRSR